MFSSPFTKISSMLFSQSLLGNLKDIQDNLAKQQTILSSGKKINKSADNPAIYFSIRKLDKRVTDSQAKEAYLDKSIDFLQKNDSYLTQVSDILEQMSSLANSAKGVSITTAEKIAIQEDLNQLSSSITDILSSGIDAKIYTGFSVSSLHGVSLSGTTTDTAVPTLAGLTLDGVNVNVTGTSAELTDSITNIDNAYNLILRDEGKLGSFIKRLEVQQDSAEIESLNLTASRSTLEDADLAETQLEITRLSILHNLSLSVMAQANSFTEKLISILL